MVVYVGFTYWFGEGREGGNGADVCLGEAIHSHLGFACVDRMSMVKPSLDTATNRRRFYHMCPNGAKIGYFVYNLQLQSRNI